MIGMAICLSVIAAQAGWWALDRTPPYVRIFGVIVPEEPRKCPGADSNISGVRPNSCVAVEWTIDILRSDCQPAGSRHVNRTITDINGVHVLAKTENIYGRGKLALSNPLRRPFILPGFSVPGDAVYSSEACFSCNPLHWIASWPICIGSPDAYYMVEEPH